VQFQRAPHWPLVTADAAIGDNAKEEMMRRFPVGFDSLANRSWKWALMGATLLVLSGGVRAADLDSLVAAARKEGQVTWYVSQYSARVADEAGTAFTKKYPGIKVNVVRATNAVTYARLTQDLRHGAHECDVFTTTALSQFVHLKKQGVLARYVPPNVAHMIPSLRNLDPDEAYYFPTIVTAVFLAYNTQKVKAADAPTSWKDLLDPKWDHKIAMGSPLFSGVVAMEVLGLHKVYGWDYFKQLMKNHPLVGRSVNDVVTMLNSGERTVAAGASGTAPASAARGNPIAIAYPSDGTVLIKPPTAVLEKAPHPNAARLFENFLLGKIHGAIAARDYRYPVRADVPLPKGLKPLSEVKVIPLTEKDVVEGIPQVRKEWRGIFGG
jgi:iron(III) transport system substrate-binding protein